MTSTSRNNATGAANPAPNDALLLAEPGEHQVAILSAAVLRAVMSTYGDDCTALAVRAGVGGNVVAEAVSGVCPAWALPYEEFTAIAKAVAALWPCGVFETAAACDLLLSCVLNGDQFMAADVLTEPGSRDLARTLLGLAEALLPDDLLALLRDRAAALACSGSPDAWIGAEILLMCQGWQA